MLRLRLPELLVQRGMTPYALAKVSDGRISMSTAYRLVRLRGRVETFDAAVLAALSDLLGVEPGDLLERDRGERSVRRTRTEMYKSVEGHFGALDIRGWQQSGEERGGSRWVLSHRKHVGYTVILGLDSRDSSPFWMIKRRKVTGRTEWMEVGRRVEDMAAALDHLTAFFRAAERHKLGCVLSEDRDYDGHDVFKCPHWTAMVKTHRVPRVRSRRAKSPS